MSPPRTDWFCAWMGLAGLGAVDVGVTVGFRGSMLEYNLTKGRSRILLLTAGLVELLTPDLLKAAGIEIVIVTGAVEAPTLDGVRCVTEGEFLAEKRLALDITRYAVTLDHEDFRLRVYFEDGEASVTSADKRSASTPTAAPRKQATVSTVEEVLGVLAQYLADEVA